MWKFEAVCIQISQEFRFFHSRQPTPLLKSQGLKILTGRTFFYRIGYRIIFYIVSVIGQYIGYRTIYPILAFF